MALVAGAEPLTAEQNGDQKTRYVITVDGTNCWSRQVDAKESRRCEAVPVLPPAGATLSPIGDQHLVLKDASGKPICYYHLVTDRWVMADKMAFKKGFGPVAWSVLALYFLLMAGMAWYFMRKKKTADDYFTGGGKIPWYVAGMSIFATMLSSISFLALPAQFYISDWRYFPLTLGIFALAPVVIYFYLPFFRRLKVASAYEYLERRFNAAVRLFASGAYVVFMVSRVAIVTLLPALALNAMTGVSIDGCILVCGVATIVYCAFGGFEAVVWSDFVQGIVLVTGAVAIFTALVMGTDGGLAGAWASASANGKTTLLDLRFTATEPVLWVVSVLAIIENLSTYTSDQCVIQRYMSVKDEKAAARSIWFNGIFTVFVCLVFYCIGTALWTYYRSHPEMLDPSLPKADSILPFFIVSGLPPALAGLVAAALFAATISTLSANLSSAATALTADFVLKFRPSTSRARAHGDAVALRQVQGVHLGADGRARGDVLPRRVPPPRRRARRDRRTGGQLRRVLRPALRAAAVRASARVSRRGHRVCPLRRLGVAPLVRRPRARTRPHRTDAQDTEELTDERMKIEQ